MDREGRFQIGGHPYTVCKSEHILTEGQWEVWDDEPDTTIPYVRLASPGPGPGRPVATAPTYQAVRDLIDLAARKGAFTPHGKEASSDGV